VLLRVELADPSQRTLSFGAVPRGQSASRQLALVNRGRAPALLSLGPARELLERLGIEALPAAPVVLRPREEASVTLFYRQALLAHLQLWTLGVVHWLAGRWLLYLIQTLLTMTQAVFSLAKFAPSSKTLRLNDCVTGARRQFPM
jgi:hypothetical protein